MYCISRLMCLAFMISLLKRPKITPLFPFPFLDRHPCNFLLKIRQWNFDIWGTQPRIPTNKRNTHPHVMFNHFNGFEPLHNASSIYFFTCLYYNFISLCLALIFPFTVILDLEERFLFRKQTKPLRPFATSS